MIRFIGLLLAAFVSLSSAQAKSPPPCIYNCDIRSGSIGGATGLGLSVQLPGLMRQPNIRDTCSAVRPVGYFWNDQFNRIWTSQQCSPTAAWALGVGLYSWNSATQPGLATFTQSYVGAGPCDISTAIACYGMRREKGTYLTGQLVKLLQLTDTTNTGFDLGQNSDGSPDMATLSAKCTNTLCRVVKWYDQSGNSFDAPAVKAPLVLTSTGTASGARTVVADSSGIAVNDHIDIAGGLCAGNTYIASVPDATHFTTNNGCQVANGVVFMVSKAPMVSPLNLIGNVPSLVMDSQGEWNVGAMLTLPVGVAVNANANGGVATFRAHKPARGNGLFSLTQTGATGNALTFWSQDGTMRGRTFDGGGWNLPSTTGLFLTSTPQVMAWQSDITGQAFPNEGLWIDEKFFSMGYVGSTTLAGGYIGGAVSTGASGAGGGIEFANFVVYSVNPTTAQLAAARASSYAIHGLCPQCNQFQVIIGPDSLMEGPLNKYMQNVGRQLGDFVYAAGGRLKNFGWTGQTNAFYDTNYTAFLGNSFLGTNSATNSILVWYPSNNDVSGTSCATYWNGTMRSIITKATVSGYKLLMVKIPHMVANQTFLDDCNTRMDADQPTYGYAVLDLASHAILGGSGYSNANLSLDGYHPTNLAAGIWAQAIWDTIRANWWLPAS